MIIVVRVKSERYTGIRKVDIRARIGVVIWYKKVGLWGMSGCDYGALVGVIITIRVGILY